jgi:hypothetical protein
VRVTAIYEGTNGIQAMDLVGRKMLDGGEAAFALLDQLAGESERAKQSHPDLADKVWQASETLREAVEWMAAQRDFNDRFAGATGFLRAFARVLGAHYHLCAAMNEPEPGPREKLARFYINSLLPEHIGLLDQARQGAKDIYAFHPDELV